MTEETRTTTTTRARRRLAQALLNECVLSYLQSRREILRRNESLSQGDQSRLLKIAEALAKELV